MTEDNAKNKLTLSGKSTLTLRGLSDKSKSTANDGKKIVQVEVRKKRVINPSAVNTASKVEIDEATAAKLRLIAEAKEHEAKRRQEEEEKERQRQLQKEAEEKERQARAEAEAAQPAVKEEAVPTPAAEVAAEERNVKVKEKKSKDFDEEDDEDEDERDKKFRKAVTVERPLSREEAFEQERKKVMKRSFETQRRGGKINIHSIGDDEDDDYGFGGPRRRFKKKQPKPAVVQQPQEKVIKEVIIPEETISIVSVADAKNMKDDAYVVLQGTIQQNLGDENYLFKDDSGTVVIEIDDDDWNGVTVGPQDVVIIKGQVDKGWTNVEIDVDEISKVPASK